MWQIELEISRKFEWIFSNINFVMMFISKNTLKEKQNISNVYIAALPEYKNADFNWKGSAFSLRLLFTFPI